MCANKKTIIVTSPFVLNLPLTCLSAQEKQDMRIFIKNHNAPPEQAVRQALDILFKAGIYSAEGGGTINDHPLILIDAAHVSEVIATLD
jgi:hypothetical protein